MGDVPANHAVADGIITASDVSLQQPLVVPSSVPSDLVGNRGTQYLTIKPARFGRCGNDCNIERYVQYRSMLQNATPECHATTSH
jgi:hypothetical protein